MGILTNSAHPVERFIVEHMELFGCFEHVYLFGSILNERNQYNDIDLLVIYEQYSDVIPSEIDCITATLEEMTGVPIDLTALSYEELRETEFLEKIKFNYAVLK